MQSTLNTNFHIWVTKRSNFNGNYYYRHVTKKILISNVNRKEVIYPRTLLNMEQSDTATTTTTTTNGYEVMPHELTIYKTHNFVKILYQPKDLPYQMFYTKNYECLWNGSRGYKCWRYSW